jgi:predicted nucleic acid-binding protein
MVRRFERHITLSDPARPSPHYRVVPVTASVFALAAELCNQYWRSLPSPLRSLDAIQLACAIATAASLAGDLAFVTADARLAVVAQMEGFATINPALTPLP